MILSNESEGVVLQPKWPLEDELLPLYATQFSITRTPHEVVLVFGDFIPTGLTRRSEEQIQDYLKTANIKPLSKIVMSYAGARALFTIMKENLKEIESEENKNGTLE